MATAKKHMERSHYSYHEPKPFAQFEARAKVKAARKIQKKTIGERIKAFFHRTTNK